MMLALYYYFFSGSKESTTKQVQTGSRFHTVIRPLYSALTFPLVEGVVDLPQVEKFSPLLLEGTMLVRLICYSNSHCIDAQGPLCFIKFFTCHVFQP